MVQPEVRMSLHFILLLEKKNKTLLKQTIEPHHTVLWRVPLVLAEGN